MNITYLLQGIFIGIVFGVPVGAVGILSIQRMIAYNRISGIVTGIASSLADMIYAFVGALGITFITDFIAQYEKPINIFGAMIILILGIKTFFNKNKPSQKLDEKTKYLQMFLSSFFVAITNPTTILSFLFVFTIFNINMTLGWINVFLFILGIFIGTCSWWFLLSFFVKKFRHEITDKIYMRLNQLFGVTLIVLAVGISINRG